MHMLDSGLIKRCLRFVEKQSGGEWGEKIEMADARKLANFVRHEVALARARGETV